MGIDTYELFDSVIRDNYIANTIGGGILVEDGANVLVEGNTIENNELDANGDYWDGGIWVDGSKYITLRGNTITNNHGPGLNLSDEDVQYPQSSIGFVVEGNIVTDNAFGVYMWNFGICPPPEEAISFGENQIENNTEQDIWCEEWTCGEGEACE
jgi:parallel beta-helix repeat protein